MRKCKKYTFFNLIYVCRWIIKNWPTSFMVGRCWRVFFFLKVAYETRYKLLILILIPAKEGAKSRVAMEMNECMHQLLMKRGMVNVGASLIIQVLHRNKENSFQTHCAMLCDVMWLPLAICGWRGKKLWMKKTKNH